MNYPYANGRIAVIENKILDRSKLLKLTKVEKKDFIPTLIDMGYSESGFTSLEEVIDKEILFIKTLLEEISPDKEFTDLFYLENDAINIKAMYKSKIYGINNPIKFMVYGIFSKAKLEDIIINNNLFGLDNDLKSMFNNINNDLEEVTNPRIVSAIIDNAIYGYLLKVLKKNKNPILKQYFQAKIDLANVLINVRVKRLGWDLAITKDMYIDGGVIKTEELEIAFNLKSMTNVFSNYYHNKLSKGLMKYAEDGDVNQLEMYFDELMLDIMSEYKFDAFNIGPIVYYFLKKQAEAKNIRLIYANQNLEISNLIKY